MVNSILDTLPNPFHRWAETEDVSRKGMWSYLIALWMFLWKRSVAAWSTVSHSFTSRVLVQLCYTGSKTPMATIVGLIPPTTVMSGEQKSKGKGKNKLPHTKERVTGVDKLPASWWVHAENGQHGYNYRTEVKIAGEKIVALLDGGSGINSMTE